MECLSLLPAHCISSARWHVVGTAGNRDVIARIKLLVIATNETEYELDDDDQIARLPVEGQHYSNYVSSYSEVPKMKCSYRKEADFVLWPLGSLVLCFVV